MTIIFIACIVLFFEPPPLAVGDIFYIEGSGVVESGNDLFFTVEEIIYLPEGSYPPTDGADECQVCPSSLSYKSFHLQAWAVCVSPNVGSHSGTNDGTVNLVFSPSFIFADSFEKGTSSWSETLVINPDRKYLIFQDGFESGNLQAWK